MRGGDPAGRLGRLGTVLIEVEREASPPSRIGAR